LKTTEATQAVLESVKTGLEQEAEEQPLLKFVTRKRLVKTVHVGDTWRVVNCKVWKSAIVL
jgi:hypothetical protein